MSLKSNVHVHSTWCDGKNTAPEMAQAALQLGFTDLGFSSHSPTPFDVTCPGIRDEAAYRADIARLKAEYAGRLGILCGVEEDRFATVNRADYDYVITSSHYLPPRDGVYVSVDNTLELLQDVVATWYGGDAMAMLRAYFEGVVHSVADRRPDIVGHFDLVKKFNRGNVVFDEQSAAYRELALSALDAVLDTLGTYGGMLEVNTGAWGRGLRDEPYPAPFLLRHAAQRGARVVVTGDSHSAEGLDACFEKAPVLLRQAGFETMTTLRDGRFTPVGVAD